MTRLTFFSGTKNASSWAMRAWLALRAASLEFEMVDVDIRRPQRLVNLAAIREISPPAMVPVLLVDGDAIFDSLAIMEFANEHCGGGLLPSDIVARAKARSLVAWQHGGLSAICSRISFESAFYPFKRALTSAEVGELPRLFDWLEPLLERHGGPFLFGDAGLADFALAPAAIRIGRHDPDLGRWPGVAKWMDAIDSHPLVREWMNEADQLPHIWFDDYLDPDQPPDLRRCHKVAAGKILGGSDNITRAIAMARPDCP